RFGQSRAQHNLGLKIQLALRFFCTAEASPSMVPVASRDIGNRCFIIGDLVNERGKDSDACFLPTRNIVNVTSLPTERTGDQPKAYIINIDKIPCCYPLVLDRQRQIMQRFINKRWYDITPHGGRRATPLAGAQDLPRAIDVLESGFYYGHVILRAIV